MQGSSLQFPFLLHQLASQPQLSLFSFFFPNPVKQTKQQAAAILLFPCSKSFEQQQGAHAPFLCKQRAEPRKPHLSFPPCVFPQIEQASSSSSRRVCTTTSSTSRTRRRRKRGGQARSRGRRRQERPRRAGPRGEGLRPCRNDHVEPDFNTASLHLAIYLPLHDLRGTLTVAAPAHRCYPPPCCGLQSITLCSHTTCSTVCAHQAAVRLAHDVFVEMDEPRQQAVGFPELRRQARRSSTTTETTTTTCSQVFTPDLL